MAKLERVVHIREVRCEKVSTAGGVEVYRETGYLSPSKGKERAYVTRDGQVLHAFTSKLVGNSSEMEFLQIDEMPKMVHSVRVDGRECIAIVERDEVTTYRDKDNTQIFHTVVEDKVLYSLKFTGQPNGSIQSEVMPFMANDETTKGC